MTFHTKISFVKSIYRICGFALLLNTPKMWIGVCVLIIAEVFGILEEF